MNAPGVTPSPAQKLDSFSSTHLQVINGVEISTSNPILSRYKHVWCNPHWYENVETLDPQEKSKITPTIQQVKGAKRIQTALISYVYTPPKCSNISETLLITTAVQEICKRLLEVTETSVPLQAVIETKQILAFISNDNVFLLKSPRTLRTLLWKSNFSFASVYGHSKDSRLDVNLPKEDLDALTDTKSNFPGCVRWKQLVDSNYFSNTAQSFLERWRDILIFRGTSEAKSFLTLLLEHADFAAQKLVQQKQEHLSGSGLIEIFDFSQIKRILTNFPFRGGQLGTTKLLWNNVNKSGMYNIKLECSLVPSAQHEIVKGVSQLVDLDKFNIHFNLCEDYLDIWNFFKQCKENHELREKCPEIINWLCTHGPLEDIQQGRWRTRRSLPAITPTISSENDNQLIRCSSNPLAYTKTPSKIDRYLTTPSTTCSNLTTPTISTTDSIDNIADCTASSSKSIHSNNETNSVNNSKNDDTNDQKTPVLKRFSSLSMKRVGPAPNFRSRKPSVINIPSVCGEPVLDVKDPQEILPQHYLKALTSINNKTAMFIGDFFLSPLTVTIPIQEILNNELFTSLIYSDKVEYLIISSNMPLRYLIELAPVTKKLRSFYWYKKVQQNEDKKDSLINLLSPYSDFTNDSQVPTKTSRSVFFLVTDLAIADLVSPLTTKPESRILLNANAKSLSNWLKQMKTKQDIWEEEAFKYLTEHPEKKSSVLESCPNFQIHVIVLLPVYINFQLIPTSNCNIFEEFNNNIKESIHWKSIQDNINILKDIQKQYICSIPLNPDKQMYRLNIWYLPLNYVEICYQNNGIVEGEIMVNLAFKYIDSNFVKLVESKKDVALETVKENSLEVNSETYTKKAILINKKELNNKSVKSQTKPKAPSMIQPTSNFLPFRTYLKAVNNKMRKAIFDKKTSISSQLAQNNKRKSEKLVQSELNQKKPSVRRSEPPRSTMYSDDDNVYIKPTNKYEHISIKINRKKYSKQPINAAKSLTLDKGKNKRKIHTNTTLSNTAPKLYKDHKAAKSGTIDISFLDTTPQLISNEKIINRITSKNIVNQYKDTFETQATTASTCISLNNDDLLSV